MTEDRDNNIWVATIGNPEALSRIRDFMVQEDFPAPQMPEANSLAADPQGGIWLGLADGGLARYRNGRTETFHRPETFQLEHFRAPKVNQVLVSAEGAVLGATAAGLLGWRNGTLQTMTVRNGLPCDGLYGLITDTRGALWLYTRCGLVVIGNEALERWWKDARAVVEVKVFDALDGARPAAAAFEPLTSRSPDGRLWFANENGVQMIDPVHLAENAIPPPVHIEEVVADRKSYSPRNGLRIPPLTRDLQIDYTALSFVAPQKVRFRYKLEGRDAGWQEPGTRRQAFYSDLRPGPYRFRVIACNNDGVWNDEGATLDFTIAPAWYQTTSFLLVCAVSSLLVAWTLYRLRVRQIARTIGARFDERLAERTRLARELHDTFLQTIQGSKMVADDALEQSGDPVRMRRAMEQLSGWLGRAVQEGRAALSSLRTSTTEGNDLMAALKRATESEVIPSSMAVTCSVAGDPVEMHPIVRDEIYRIGYEAILNACMHSRAARLRVELEYAQDLVLRVSDNGVGIDPAVAGHGKPGHFGLQGMRERAVRIEGKLTLSSGSTGTTISLLVPGGIAYHKERKVRLHG